MTHDRKYSKICFARTYKMPYVCSYAPSEFHEYYIGLVSVCQCEKLEAAVVTAPFVSYSHISSSTYMIRVNASLTFIVMM